MCLYIDVHYFAIIFICHYCHYITFISILVLFLSAIIFAIHYFLTTCMFANPHIPVFAMRVYFVYSVLTYIHFKFKLKFNVFTDISKCWLTIWSESEYIQLHR